MLIKEISTQHPDKNNYFIRDTKKEYQRDPTTKFFYKTLKEYDKSILNYYEINKKYNLLDYKIIKL